MQHDELLKAIFNHMKTIADIPELRFPNINYNEHTSEYVSVYVMPVEPQDIGINSIVKYSGIIQINVSINFSIGEIKAAEYVQKIVNAFPRGTVLTNGSTSVRIDKTPRIFQGLKEASKWTVPIRVLYEKMC